MAIVLTLFPPRVWTFRFSSADASTSPHDARDPGGQELTGNFAWDCDFHVNSGIFYMPQFYDMGPTALLPFRRKACWGFFRPEKSRRLRPGLNPRTWVLKGSTLSLDHRSLFMTCHWNKLHIFVYKIQYVNSINIQQFAEWCYLLRFMIVKCDKLERTGVGLAWHISSLYLQNMRSVTKTAVLAPLASEAL